MNPKRNKPWDRKLSQEERSAAGLDVPKKEGPQSGRKPETLQTFWRERLQPWLDFANLLPFESTGDGWRQVAFDSDIAIAAFVSEFAESRNRHPLKRLAERIARLRTGKQEMLRVFASVYDSFRRLEGTTWPSPEAESDDPWAEHYDSIPLNIPYFIEDKGDGRASFVQDATLLQFKEALNGAEISRIRRCPFCGKFYYAVRDNKGACDAHLARARVERGRDPELRRRYEATRRINKLTKDGVPLDKAKAVTKRNARGRRKK